MELTVVSDAGVRVPVDIGMEDTVGYLRERAAELLSIEDALLYAASGKLDDDEVLLSSAGLSSGDEVRVIGIVGPRVGKGVVLQRASQQTPHTQDLSLSITLMGGSGVGKSSIVMRFCEGCFHPNIPATCGVADARLRVCVAGRMCSVRLYDPSGRVCTSSKSSIHESISSSVLMVYDITQRSSFSDMASRLASLRARFPELPVVLVGNKSDLSDQREVSKQEARAVAAGTGSFFVETSAANGDFIDEAFSKVLSVLGQEQCRAPKERGPRVAGGMKCIIS